MQIADQAGYQTLQVIAGADHFNEWTYQTIRPFLKGSILEIGSGIGNISKYVIAEHTPVTLSDIDQGYCQYLQKKFGDDGHVSAILQVDLQHPDFCNCYRDLKENFDTVFILNVIEHLEDDSKAICNCKYLLKTGGTLITLVPAYRFLYSDLDKELGHYRRYTSRSIAGIIHREGLTIIKNKYFNILGIPGWLFSGVFLRSKRISQSEMTAFNRLVPLAKIADKLFLHSLGLSIITVAEK